ncbi:SixA phosphatase family protein [Marinoscillum furvescens]|uniref:Phosphohistidine phosphatase n=1 Tax=Marinoscillum furvescens DSM 4134 TaxID=1122208 RepID=A0A3D9LJ10_MARFU|nr:histidine phosphatase family protein [Marinoscillum furvescens]REE05646.1 phosphohistidine phosphatase [Marinoscillum furvescens DSM 4134]
MVRNLYLLRHGRAAHGFDMADIDRPLISTGIAQLTELGAYMKTKGFDPDKIFCSTAKRTRETAKVITEQIGYSRPVEYREDIYEASVKTLFEIVVGCDDAHQTVLIIGHNPGVSYLYDYLTESNFGDMTPGELVKIEFEDLSWKEVSQGLGVKKTL